MKKEYGGRTHRRTDIETYRVACTRLKIKSERKRLSWQRKKEGDNWQAQLVQPVQLGQWAKQGSNGFSMERNLGSSLREFEAVPISFRFHALFIRWIGR